MFPGSTRKQSLSTSWDACKARDMYVNTTEVVSPDTAPTTSLAAAEALETLSSPVATTAPPKHRLRASESTSLASTFVGSKRSASTTSNRDRPQWCDATAARARSTYNSTARGAFFKSEFADFVARALRPAATSLAMPACVFLWDAAFAINSSALLECRVPCARRAACAQASHSPLNKRTSACKKKALRRTTASSGVTHLRAKASSFSKHARARFARSSTTAAS
mmetsp:Transcript_6800/g.25697  ORF Transcript_6800/g.25697 Transcript_6800/m.25697 type:complete len:224 (+) Transcript_6800:2216-2887(+)